jgi:hypothetical protein
MWLNYSSTKKELKLKLNIMSQLVISESQLKLNNQIQEQVILINNLLLKAKEENLKVEIKTPSKTIGLDGALESSYYNEIKINLFVLL